MSEKGVTVMARMSSPRDIIYVLQDYQKMIENFEDEEHIKESSPITVIDIITKMNTDWAVFDAWYQDTKKSYDDFLEELAGYYKERQSENPPTTSERGGE